ncbi:SAF domain-containing protein [Sanguibacter sp. HDW7]|uniref:SAF domain-containing protein n=1 Tax=Sanguibacter sp. HDW7 TaxID=2714931 RepID=UPI00140757EA|nr:SAF domain-containing protein [Sanguibacter sp. HDW7]QIK82898.1 hypothetical protein G7063_04110 [Sanguibacter sp. HDW7]
MNRPAATGVPAQAPRLQRPGWKDPRLVVGVLLVAGSVALGSWTVRAARQTVPVLAAVTDLPAGHVLTDADLRPVEVALGPTGERYLGSDDAVAGAVLARPVRAGELVPGTLLVTRAEAGLRTVAIPLSGPLPGDVRVGGLVDVWLLPAPDPAGKEATAPHAVAQGLDVTAVATESGAFGSGLGPGTTVEVRVGDADLPTVLGALAAEGDLAIVAAAVGPQPGPATAPAAAPATGTP